MNEPLKYKAWHITEQKMAEVHDLSLAQQIAYVWGVPYGWQFKDIELREFVGLKDKHNKEIYAGDILQLSNGRRACVIWHNAAFCWDLLALNSEGLAVPFASLRYTDFEIIGNRFENSELLLAMQGTLMQVHSMSKGKETL